MPSRRSFLTAAVGAAAPAFSQQRPRNVLLMIADDLGRHTGAYGDTNARTPHLDRMAREGVRFNNAFCTTASCSASRSVILSGLQNHANGQYGHAHAEHHFGYLPHVRPIPDLLKDKGYRTGVIGKLHVNPIERFRWDLDSQGNSRDVASMADRAKQFVQAAAGRPWYLHVGFADPHRAAQGFANRDYRSVTRNRFDPAKLKMPSFLPDNAAARGETAGYYEAANRMDQGIGMFFDVLKQTGQLDNTLVIFLSDNGMPFPNAKTNTYDAGIHLPLLVWSPDQKRRGVVNNAFASWVDILPTALDWAGAKLPDYPIHGRSLLPILDQENPAGWDQVFFSHQFHEVTMYYPMRGTRTARYKYIRNLFPTLEFPHASDLFRSDTWQSVRAAGEPAKVGRRAAVKYLYRTPEELYDITKDPDEVSNLAESAAHRGALGDLRIQVHEWRKRTKDPWLINDEYQPTFAGGSR